MWSNNEIIAAASRQKVCLYHPFNGFTRALDIDDRICMTFSNSGNYLAMAYRKSGDVRPGATTNDLFVFRIDRKTLFESDNLDTEKMSSATPHDITALCYSKDDEYLMCGTDVGKILMLECNLQNLENSGKQQKWKFDKVLTSNDTEEIFKISFSAKFRYMASLDVNGQLVIWSASTWTMLFVVQKEKSRLYKHLEWHPFVEEELVIGKTSYPALYLINVAQKEVVAGYSNWKDDMEMTSIAFNPKTAQLAVCFYMKGELCCYVEASKNCTFSSCRRVHQPGLDTRINVASHQFV